MLEIKNLTKKYNNFLALENINLKINSGEIVGLVGDNGTEKTTLINCILGTIKKNSGEILLNNLPIENNKKDSLKFFFMPDLLSFSLDFTVKEYVSYLALLKKENKKECLKKLDFVFNELEYEKSLKNKKINKMSAGQKKKNILCCFIKFGSRVFNFRWANC